MPEGKEMRRQQLYVAKNYIWNNSNVAKTAEQFYA
jgi:hypothetical protein